MGCKREGEGPRKREWEKFMEENGRDVREGNMEYMRDVNYITIETRELDGEITKEEVRLGAKRIKGNKAVGTDLVQGRIWKELLKVDSYIELVAKLFNKMYKNEMFPERWKVAEVVPIYKNKGKRGDPCNYRNISILSALMKLYTGILANRLNVWAEKYNIVSKWQNGFRRNKRIMDNVLIMQTVSEKYLKKKRGKIYWCFIDLERAYDKVCRNKLWWVLRNKGVSAKFIGNLKGIYADISFRIRVNKFGETTDKFQQNVGVRQGCNLSPYLFIYIHR